jgi:H+/Cl- antiporter ClcA
LSQVESFSTDEHHVLLSTERWRHRAALWVGALAVALAAIVFARGGEWCYGLFVRVLGSSRFWPFLILPLGFGLLYRATEGALRGTRGSGIPQVMAAIARGQDAPFRESLLSLPVAAGKLVLTLFAMLIGASVGREGPTVHVGAGIMAWTAQRFGFRDAATVSRFVLAGGAAGIAAAFNTPLAGVMFAIEELAGAYEHRFSGALLTAVMISGLVSLGLIGDYAYFGRISASLPIRAFWPAVLATGVVGGLAGGLFARTVLATTAATPRMLGGLRRKSPLVFSMLCGLLLAVVGYASNDAVYGTGYAQVREIIGGHHAITPWFGLAKWVANVLSYAGGIPGGIFSPALAVGAGLGANLAPWFPSGEATVVILLGMSAYLAGVTQAPLTSAVISMELADDHKLVIPIIAACLIARALSTLLCKKPLYRALAERLLLQHDAAPAPERKPKPEESAG